MGNIFKFKFTLLYQIETTAAIVTSILIFYFLLHSGFSLYTHHSHRCGSCGTCLPGLPHGSSCGSHLPWLGRALPNAHALSLGWRLLLKASGRCDTRLPGPGCCCLCLLLELGPLSWSAVCLGTWTTLSS